MILFYISTWPSGSGLAKATVLPHLEELAKHINVKRIFYFSIEDNPFQESSITTGKITHIPFVRQKLPISVLRHIIEHTYFRRKLEKIAARYMPSLVFCKGAPAGIYGYRILQKFNVPFINESYEPHAEYMRYAGVWSRLDPKYIVQTIWEKKIKRHASALITVSESYRSHLEREERIEPIRLLNVPCWVDTDSFSYDNDVRIRIRGELGVKGHLICIYVGKFGGLYYEKEAFETLSAIKNELDKKLFVLILSPDSRGKIRSALSAHGFASTDFCVKSVDHSEVSSYLSVADFAISFVKPTPYSQFCSPIKHAEYWACGLPVLLPNNVGEETNWVEDEKAGAMADVHRTSSVAAATRKILAILKEKGHRGRIREVARRRRGKQALGQAYGKILHRYAR
jgi:glycosyltransferase involved in cell wall biosynthesis